MKFKNTMRQGSLFIAALLLFSFFSLPSAVQAQGSLSLSTVQANNGQTGVAFDITALQSTKLYRFWVETYSGSNTIEIWMNPDGMYTTPGSFRTTGWVKLGEATFTAAGTPNYDEIPYDLDLLMDPGVTHGFIIWRTNGTLRYRSGTPPFVFSDSYISINTQGHGVYGTMPSPGHAFYPRQFCGAVYYDEGCFFPDGSISYELLDAQMQPSSFANIPGSVNLKYNVTFPDEESNVNITMDLRNVITDDLVYSYSFSALKQANQTLNGVENIPLPGTLPSGYFKVDVTFNTKNSCMDYDDYQAPSTTLLLLPPGAQMCLVWPGDANNDGVVNYADRADLNTYIHDANLRSSWLEGPTRFSITGGMDYLEWKAQPSAPWQTSDGCYMDTDGNGVVNNFDYIAIKLNWMRTHSTIEAKQSPAFSTVTFDLDQNYPNPFNPSTTLRYAAPERSQVRLVVSDMLGREITTLVDETVDAGVHTATFDAGTLPSGNYVATVHMTGIESGLTFNKTVRMTMSK
ncbi:MAG: T9SS type A sorting domain-containing protein [Bacteroidetes bacterium]|nr:T9SS type A sorting domain-containing protein [Bacteroidota bacterium]